MRSVTRRGYDSRFLVMLLCLCGVSRNNFPIVLYKIYNEKLMIAESRYRRDRGARANSEKINQEQGTAVSRLRQMLQHIQ